MAGAGQPWYMPLTWPVGHVTTAVFRKENEQIPKPTATPDLDLIGHITSFAGATRSFLLAYLCIYGFSLDGFSQDGTNDHLPSYPALDGRAATFDLMGWVFPILVRNLVATWAICGFWDWFLYFSPLRDKLAKFKLNPKYPPWSQFTHDAFWTTSASITGAGVEVLCCYCWCNGHFPACDRTLTEKPIKTLLWAIAITHWRVPHFWVIHRCMHPWRNARLSKLLGFDPGVFLYKHVHSLHHKSYNPTAFSGTSMHPVESTLYYSAALLAVPFGCHPAISLGCIIDCAVGAWLGHDGFQWPGSGDFFHQLHHDCFDCNYGAMHVPIDKWLGTFVGSREDLKRIWRVVAVEGARPPPSPAAPKSTSVQQGTGADGAGIRRVVQEGGEKGGSSPKRARGNARTKSPGVRARGVAGEGPKNRS